MLTPALRAARTLLGFMAAPHAADGQPGIRETRLALAHGAADLYEPPGAPRRTLVLVHGVTFQGSRDVRLVRFARKLAVSGLRVAAIDLPGLKRCEFLAEDVAAIGRLASDLASDGAPVGLVGFSFGAGLGLTAACQDRVRDAFGPILCFGAYHSLEAVWEHCFRWCAREPRTKSDWDDFVYMMLVMAYGARERLELGEAELARITALLESYCAEPSLERKREAYRAVRHLPVTDAFRETLDPVRLRAVSPAGRLDRLRGRVNLLHDSRDRIVPPEQAMRLFEELGSGDRASVLVTPLLSHIYLGSVRGVFDLPRLLGMMGDAIG